MSKVKPRLARLLFIDEMLRKNNFPNCSSIAEKYEVSSKTIQRDIENMKDMYDAPIEYNSSKKGFYYTEPNYYLPAINIKESDFFAICIAEKALEQYENTQIYDHLSSVFEKISKYLPNEITVNTSWVDTRITFMQDSHTRIIPEIWEKISLGLCSQKQLLIKHRKTGGDPVSRYVNPYHIVSYKGEWYLIAYCHKRKDVVRFAILRILDANVTDKSFKVPDDFDFKSFMGSNFGIMTGEKEYNVKIKFSKSQAPYITERIWHREQSVKMNKDGSVILSFKTNSLFEVKRWVLSWGKDAKVISPKYLADEIKKELKEIIKHYSG